MGKNLVTVLLGIVLSMGGLVWISGKAANKTDLATAQMTPNTFDDSQPVINERATATQDSNKAVTQPAANDESYSAGYRDGWRDASEPRSMSAASSRVRYGGTTHAARRSKVAGATYYARNRRGHSTRNAILTVAAPAALGAGVGAIAGGKRGAGAGALIGGGAGALYYLIKRKR